MRLRQLFGPDRYDFRKGVEGLSRLPYPGSQGNVFTNTPEGSTLSKRLGGAILESKQAAEAHGLRLCKKWINENLST